eukprot:CAMPEP_0113455402 /NCGR_PEP_ID=MMETSP0014_2-20120614/8358_1 /TAXON_ID=2857 /ORGANISM="Nitzschia sp." /LENGTH=317 /DNA_ID=CAMNT_0000346833 /DNA_START=61 /DNA_END=1014 /DNA_ORIENTATION=+ /assembly_acc=CAM_ASM_000159
MSVNAAVHTLLVSAIFLVAFHSPLRSTSFQLGNVFKAFTPQPTAGKIKIGGGQRGDVIDARTKLLKTISETQNGKDASVETQRQVLDLVEFLEASSTSSRRSVDDIVRLVDGTWFLDYTQPIEIEGDGDEVVVTIDDDEEGSSSLPPSSYKVSSKSLTKTGGQVNFLGLTTVDVSGGNDDIESSSSSSNGSDETSNKPSTTTQSIDVKNQRITNRVTKSGFVSTIQVAGSYDVDEELLLLSSSSSAPSFRIIVSFDTCLIELLDGKFTLDLGFLFDLRALTQNGSKVGGWLETTYVDDKIRIGRGNRGSLFILSRGN